MGKNKVETNSTLISRPDPLTSLFENLSKGETPDFLQMMAAIAEVSEIMTPPGNCPDCHTAG